MPSWLSPQVIVSALTILVMIHVILIVCVAYGVYLERKVSAYIQDRLGPNRVGFDFGLPFLAPLRGMIGLGQPLADGIKFILKEDFTPNRVDKILFSLAPIFAVAPALMGFIVIPWGGTWDGVLFGNQLTDGPVHVTGAHIDVGIIYILAVASLGVYGVTLGGWAGNNKFSFLGGLRATAQMISYEIPMGLALLTALLVVGGVMPDAIVRYQAEHGWLLFSQPVAAIVFFIAILAEANRAPFDNAEAEQELVGGYHTEYSSMRFALFFLGEYAHLTTSSAFFALLFLGGYHLPFVGPLDPASTTIGAVVIKIIAYVTKVMLIIVFSMVVRWTIPRLRYDQVMAMAWHGVIPLALAHVVVVSTMIFLGLTLWWQMLLANLGVLALLMAFAPMLRSATVNKKLRLYGSRFSPLEGELVRTQSSEPFAHEDRPVQGTAPTIS